MLLETTGGDKSETYPRIVCEKTYVACDDKEDVMPPFWEWLKSLRGLIYETWRGKFVDVAHCVMSQEEEEAHANATRCYVCLETFKASGSLGDEEEEDVVDFVIGGEAMQKKVKKCIKVLDHNHHNSRYRGMQDHTYFIHLLSSNIFVRCMLPELQHGFGAKALQHPDSCPQHVNNFNYNK